MNMDIVFLFLVVVFAAGCATGWYMKGHQDVTR